MHPVILKLGPITIYSYGLMVALAFILATYLAQKQASFKGIEPKRIVDLALYLVVFGIVGGRLFYVLINLDDYISNPLEIIMIHHGGLAIYGGIILGSLAGILFLVKNRLPVFKTVDLVIPYVALGQAIGRIGCLLNGCCYGRPTTGAFGIYFPGNTYLLHPTQIYSSLSMLALFIVLRTLQRFTPLDSRHLTGFELKEGSIFLLYLLLYATIRFSIDFFRGDTPRIIWGLTIYQIISIVMFVILLPILIMRSQIRN